MSEVRRSTAARAGIAALNLLLPGLGVLATGKVRPALLLMALLFAPYLMLAAYYAVAPELRFAGYLIALLLAVGSVLGVLAASIWLSWRHGALREEAPGMVSRWYAIAAVLAIGWLLLPLATTVPRSFYKPFTCPRTIWPRPC
jgi:hypothetical protein